MTWWLYFSTGLPDTASIPKRWIRGLGRERKVRNCKLPPSVTDRRFSPSRRATSPFAACLKVSVIPFQHGIIDVQLMARLADAVAFPGVNHKLAGHLEMLERAVKFSGLRNGNHVVVFTM